ncbi:MAG: IS110 family transposase [Thermoleophilaceae bacterium]
MRAICGIDWASESHDVRIAERQSGELICQRRFAHDEAGVLALIGVLVAHRVELVAIERPDGLLVGRLLAAGLGVLAIHPNQVKAACDRFRAAAGKSDVFDSFSFVLCELARTDSHRFPALAPSSDETLALRALVRTREDLVAARVGLANQLRPQLDCFWPGAARIFADVDSQIALAFLQRYPSRPDAHGLGPKRLEGFLAVHEHAHGDREVLHDGERDHPDELKPGQVAEQQDQLRVALGPDDGRLQQHRRDHEQQHAQGAHPELCIREWGGLALHALHLGRDHTHERPRQGTRQDREHQPGLHPVPVVQVEVADLLRAVARRGQRHQPGQEDEAHDREQHGGGPAPQAEHLDPCRDGSHRLGAE